MVQWQHAAFASTLSLQAEKGLNPKENKVSQVNPLYQSRNSKTFGA
jgi:hypothetical protein